MIQANSNHFSYRTAIYCRLSKDDEQKGESASIQNQRDMLEHYVKAKGWNIVDVYVDDGYTGLNTNRPSFQRLIKDVENKKIDIFMYINDISNILDKNIFLMNFMSANDVIKLINEKYNIYKENTSINEKQILTNIQNSINKKIIEYFKE